MSKTIEKDAFITPGLAYLDQVQKTECKDFIKAFVVDNVDLVFIHAPCPDGAMCGYQWMRICCWDTSGRHNLNKFDPNASVITPAQVKGKTILFLDQCPSNLNELVSASKQFFVCDHHTDSLAKAVGSVEQKNLDKLKVAYHPKECASMIFWKTVASNAFYQQSKKNTQEHKFMQTLLTMINMNDLGGLEWNTEEQKAVGALTRLWTSETWFATLFKLVYSTDIAWENLWAEFVTWGGPIHLQNQNKIRSLLFSGGLENSGKDAKDAKDTKHSKDAKDVKEPKWVTCELDQQTCWCVVVADGQGIFATEMASMLRKMFTEDESYTHPVRAKKFDYLLVGSPNLATNQFKVSIRRWQMPDPIPDPFETVSSPTFASGSSFPDTPQQQQQQKLQDASAFARARGGNGHPGAASFALQGVEPPTNWQLELDPKTSSRLFPLSSKK